MNLEKRVYLAGPITSLDFKGATDWRKYAQKELAKADITGVSPMRAKDYLKQETNLSALGYSDRPMSCSRGIITRDRNDVRTADLLLVNLLGAKQISLGTAVEYGWADAYRVPIITVIEKEGNPHEHAFIRELTGFRVETLEEGIYLAKAILTYQHG